MIVLHLIQIGDEVGVVLPDELTTRLNWKAGDIVSLDETASGVTLSKPQTEFEYQLEVGRRVMRERRGVLSALAKSDTER